MNSPPFFIVGSGRSGSTLLRVILASHSRLGIPPETWFIRPLLRQFGDIQRPLSPEQIDRVFRFMINHFRWPDMHLDPADFQKAIVSIPQPLLASIIEVVYQKHLEKHGKIRWGDKTPGYIEIVPQLSEMFPGAQFIHFFRDGRDVAKSFQARGWYGRWLHQNTREWTEAMDFDERWSRSPLANAIFPMRYEDLVLAPEKMIRNVCEFLNERFEPKMLSWHENVEPLVPAREAHIHTKLKKTPGSEDVYRWKREMTSREVFVSEAFMNAHLRRLGYECVYNSALWAPMLKFTRWYCQTVFSLFGAGFRCMRSWRERIIPKRNKNRQSPACG